MIPYDIGTTYLALRRWSDAEHEMTRALALDSHYTLAKTNLARTYVNSTGNIRRARQESEGVPGHAEDAVKILRRLLTIPAGHVISLARLKIDPVWDPIRTDPDVQRLLSGPEPATIYK